MGAPSEWLEQAQGQGCCKRCPKGQTLRQQLHRCQRQVQTATGVHVLEIKSSRPVFGGLASLKPAFWAGGNPREGRHHVGWASMISCLLYRSTRRADGVFGKHSLM
jgi:hypothetical protein